MCIVYLGWKCTKTLAYTAHSNSTQTGFQVFGAVFSASHTHTKRSTYKKVCYHLRTKPPSSSAKRQEINSKSSHDKGSGTVNLRQPSDTAILSLRKFFLKPAVLSSMYNWWQWKMIFLSSISNVELGGCVIPWQGGDNYAFLCHVENL